MHELSILQSLDELELFLFHFTDHLLVVHSNSVFFHNLVFKILSGHCSFLCHHMSPLLFCFSFLIPNHLFDACCFKCFLLLLDLKELFLLLLLHLPALHVAPYLLVIVRLGVLDSLVLDFFRLKVVLYLLLFIDLFLSLTLLFSLLHFLISLLHVSDVSGSFLRLVYLLTGFLFLVLKELNSI